MSELETLTAMVLFGEVEELVNKSGEKLDFWNTLKMSLWPPKRILHPLSNLLYTAGITYAFGPAVLHEIQLAIGFLGQNLLCDFLIEMLPFLGKKALIVLEETADELHADKGVAIMRYLIVSQLLKQCIPSNKKMLKEQLLMLFTYGDQIMNPVYVKSSIEDFSMTRYQGNDFVKNFKTNHKIFGKFWASVQGLVSEDLKEHSLKKYDIRQGAKTTNYRYIPWNKWVSFQRFWAGLLLLNYSRELTHGAAFTALAAHSVSDAAFNDIFASLAGDTMAGGAQLIRSEAIKQYGITADSISLFKTKKDGKPWIAQCTNLARKAHGSITNENQKVFEACLNSIMKPNTQAIVEYYINKEKQASRKDMIAKNVSEKLNIMLSRLFLPLPDTFETGQWKAASVILRELYFEKHEQKITIPDNMLKYYLKQRMRRKDFIPKAIKDDLVNTTVLKKEIVKDILNENFILAMKDRTNSLLFLKAPEEDLTHLIRLMISKQYIHKDDFDVVAVEITGPAARLNYCLYDSGKFTSNTHLPTGVSVVWALIVPRIPHLSFKENALIAPQESDLNKQIRATVRAKKSNNTQEGGLDWAKTMMKSKPSLDTHPTLNTIMDYITRSNNITTYYNLKTESKLYEDYAEIKTLGDKAKNVISTLTNGLATMAIGLLTLRLCQAINSWRLILISFAKYVLQLKSFFREHSPEMLMQRVAIISALVWYICKKHLPIELDTDKSDFKRSLQKILEESKVNEKVDIQKFITSVHDKWGIILVPEDIERHLKPKKSLWNAFSTKSQGTIFEELADKYFPESKEHTLWRHRFEGLRNLMKYCEHLNFCMALSGILPSDVEWSGEVFHKKMGSTKELYTINILPSVEYCEKERNFVIDTFVFKYLMTHIQLVSGMERERSIHLLKQYIRDINDHWEGDSLNNILQFIRISFLHLQNTSKQLQEQQINIAQKEINQINAAIEDRLEELSAPQKMLQLRKFWQLKSFINKCNNTKTKSNLLGQPFKLQEIVDAGRKLADDIYKQQNDTVKDIKSKVNGLEVEGLIIQHFTSYDPSDRELLYASKLEVERKEGIILEVNERTYLDITYSPNSKQIAACINEEEKGYSICMYDLEKAIFDPLYPQIKIPLQNKCKRLVYNRNSTHFAVILEGHVRDFIHVYTHEGKLISMRDIAPEGFRALDIAFQADEYTLITASNQGLHLWASIPEGVWKDRVLSITPLIFDVPIKSLDVTFNNDYVAGAENIIYIPNQKHFKVSNAAIHNIKLLMDGDTLLYSLSTEVVVVKLSSPNMTDIQSIKPANKRFNNIQKFTLSQDEDRLAVRDDMGNIFVYSMSQKKVIGEYIIPTPIEVSVVSSDKSAVAEYAINSKDIVKAMSFDTSGERLLACTSHTCCVFQLPKDYTGEHAFVLAMSDAAQPPPNANARANSKKEPYLVWKDGAVPLRRFTRKR